MDILIFIDNLQKAIKCDDVVDLIKKIIINSEPNIKNKEKYNKIINIFNFDNVMTKTVLSDYNNELDKLKNKYSIIIVYGIETGYSGCSVEDNVVFDKDEWDNMSEHEKGTTMQNYINEMTESYYYEKET